MKYFSSDKEKHPSSRKPSATIYTLYPKKLSQTILEKSTTFRWKTLEFWKDVAASLTIIVVLLGQGLNWELTRQSQTLDRALEDLRDKRAFRDKVILAVTTMREVNAKHVLLCRSGKPAPLKDQIIERDHARFQAISAFSVSKEGFNQEAEQAFNMLMSFDEKIDNVCADGSPTDWTWQQHASHFFESTLKNL